MDPSKKPSPPRPPVLQKMGTFDFLQQLSTAVAKHHEKLESSNEPSDTSDSELPKTPDLSKKTKPPPIPSKKLKPPPIPLEKPKPPDPSEEPEPPDSSEEPVIRNRTSDPKMMEKQKSWREDSINEENKSRFTGNFYKILKESLDTERTYIKDLEVLLEYYSVIVAEFTKTHSERLVDPIPEGLTKTKIKKIFEKVPSLLNFHQEQFPVFEKVTSEPKAISDVLLRKKNKILRLYGDFIIDMSANLEVLDEFNEYFFVSLFIF